MPRLLTTMVMDVEAPSREEALVEAKRAAGRLRATDDESARLLEAITAALESAVESTNESDGPVVGLRASLESLRAEALADYRASFPCSGEDPITDEQVIEDCARLALSVSLIGGEWDVEILRTTDETAIIRACECTHESPEAAIEAMRSELA